MVYIPNGFDVSKFAFSPGRRVNARKRWGVRLDVITVGIVARHDPQKNHAGFFRLIACLRDYLPHVVGVGIGTGISYETPELSSAARTHGVDQNVVLLGPSKEIHEDYSGLDFVVCVSTFGEAFPNVLAEAMCAGCHVLSFDVGDARNILGNPASVFAVGDIAGMARRIVTLARSWCDGVLPRDSQALPRISEHFNLDTVVQRYEQLLRSSPERGIL